MAQNFDPKNTANQANQPAQNQGGADNMTLGNAGTGSLTGSSAEFGAPNAPGLGGGMSNDSDYESSQQYGQQDQQTYGQQGQGGNAGGGPSQTGMGNTGKSPGGPNSNAGSQTNSGPGGDFGGGYQQGTGDFQEKSGTGGQFKTGGGNNSGTPTQGKE